MRVYSMDHRPSCKAHRSGFKVSLPDRYVLNAFKIDDKYFVPGMIWTASKDYHDGVDIQIVLNRINSLRGSKTIQWDKYGENLKITLFIPKSSEVIIMLDQSVLCHI